YTTSSIIQLWNVDTQRVIQEYSFYDPSGYYGDSTILGFSPDSRFFAVADNPFVPLRIWNVQNPGAVYRTLETRPYGDVQAVAFSPDDKQILVGMDRGLHLWSLVDSSEAAIDFAPFGQAATVSSLAFSPDGSTALITDGNSGVSLWDLHSRSLIRQFNTQSDEVSQAVFSPGDGRFILMLGKAGASLWDTKSGQHQHDYSGGLLGVFSPDGRSVITGEYDDKANTTMLALWDLETGNKIRSIGPLPGSVGGLGVAPDGKSIYYGIGDRVVWWSQDSGSP
ncbi:MAG TPA: hypothetical protein VMT34_01865, partial [Aggregatilineales bacterium]|nr:hypothetical protein [Aggregatilineales bacterium]